MKRVSVLIIMLFFVMAGAMKAQTYNIVIKGGHVIDPKNNINEVMDVAVKDGKIAKLAKNIDAKEGIQVVNAQGLYLSLIHISEPTRPY